MAKRHVANVKTVGSSPTRHSISLLTLTKGDFMAPVAVSPDKKITYIVSLMIRVRRYLLAKGYTQQDKDVKDDRYYYIGHKGSYKMRVMDPARWDSTKLCVHITREMYEDEILKLVSEMMVDFPEFKSAQVELMDI